MSLAKRKKARARKSFVILPRRMLLRCDEWKGLSAASKILYPYIKAKYNGTNNGKIRLHYSELEGVKGISSSNTISTAFKELEQKGWIKREKKGGLYRYNNEYELTGKYDDYIN